MHHRENFEAGCQQCHVKEIVTEMADTLNAGPRNFPPARLHGLPSLRRFRPRARGDDDGQPADPPARAAESRVGRARSASPSEKADRTRDNDEAQRLYQHANDLKVRITGLDAKVEQVDIRASDLIREIKKVGPSLKEVRMKMHKEWFPVWLEDPHKWRPGTKMPTFRLDQDEIKAIAAFIWQSGVTGNLPYASQGRSGQGQGSLRDARLHGVPLDGRGQRQAGRNVRRQSEPRRREGQLRLPGPLDSQSARAHAALLPVRKARPHRGRLQEEGPAVRLRYRSRQVPQRRARVAGGADDADAQPAPDHRRGARHRELPDDAQARRRDLRRGRLSWTIPS